MRARCFWGLFFVSQKSVVSQKHFLPIFLVIVPFCDTKCVTRDFGHQILEFQNLLVFFDDLPPFGEVLLSVSV